MSEEHWLDTFTRAARAGGASDAIIRFHEQHHDIIREFSCLMWSSYLGSIGLGDPIGLNGPHLVTMVPACKELLPRLQELIDLVGIGEISVFVRLGHEQMVQDTRARRGLPPL